MKRELDITFFLGQVCPRGKGKTRNTRPGLLQHLELHALHFAGDKYVGSLTSPAGHITLKMQETGPSAYSLYPRRLECLTVTINYAMFNKVHCSSIFLSAHALCT